MNSATTRWAAPRTLWGEIALGLFLLFGAAYLVFPDALYTAGPITYARYAILFPLIGLMLWEKSPIKASPATMLGLAWAGVLVVAVLVGTPAQRAALYLIPASFLLLPPTLSNRLPRLMLICLVAAALGAAAEHYLIGGFERFHGMGLRLSSIYLNPNNLAVVAVLACAYAFRLPSPWARGASVIATIVLVFVSGSKTGLVLAVLLFGWCMWRWRPWLAVPTLFAAAGFSVFVAMVVWPRSAWHGILYRIEQISHSVSGTRNFAFPWIGVGPNYADNAYLQTWNEVGLPALSVYVATLTYVSWRDRGNSPLWLLFAAAGLSENINYLWPVAYLFWAYVGSGPIIPAPPCESDARMKV